MCHAVHTLHWWHPQNGHRTSFGLSNQIVKTVQGRCRKLADTASDFGLFLHTSLEVLPNFSLIESISVFLHTSPAVSISVSIISVYKVTIVKAHLTFKKLKKLAVVELVKAHLKFKKLKKLAVVALVSVKYHYISPFHYPKENSLHESVNLMKISSLTQTFTP